MAKISLKGQFNFKGNGNLIEALYKIKVLKQLKNELLICGDRHKPQKIYSVPTGKQIVYARIDNSGPGPNDWRVAVMVETIPDKPVKIENYNLQENATGTLIYIVNDSGEIKEVEQIYLSQKEGTIADCKTYLGNHSCYQIEKKKQQVKATFTADKTYDAGERTTYLIRYNNDEIQSYIDSTSLWDVKFHRVFSNLKPSNIVSGKIVRKARVKSTKKPFLYYKPYHRFKPIYDNYLQENFVSAWEIQVFDLVPAKDGYPTKTHEMPGKDELDDRDSYINKMTDFINICGQGGGGVQVLYAYDYYPMWESCPSYTSYGGASCIRRFPGYHNGVGVPYPCFKASCSVTRMGEHDKNECIRKPGVIVDSYDCRILGGYSFEQTPPFSASFTEDGGAVINGFFGGTGQLINEGDELTVVRGRLRIIGTRFPRLLSDEKNREIMARSGYDSNAAALSHFNEDLSKLLADSFNKFVMDVKVLAAGRPYSNCIRPDTSYTGGTTGSLYEGEEPRLAISDSDPGKAEEYKTQNFLFLFAKESLINKTIGGYFSLKLKDEDDNLLHQDFYKDINQEQGVTITPTVNSDISINAFVIPSSQKNLTKNKTAMLNKASTWKINKYTLSLGDIEKNDSSYSSEEISSQVLPLGNFDKILSYSYYDA